MRSKILFFGDTIGRVGRQALLLAVPDIRREYEPDFVSINVENIAHGKGVTVRTLEEIAPLGADAYTSGNHVFDKGEITAQAFAAYPQLIRPANYAGSFLGGEFPGRGFFRTEKNGQGFLVINLNAQVFFEKQFIGQITSPFAMLDQILNDHKRPDDIVIIDFHSEATSEKRAFGFYADGRAALVVGTHTHVATADLQILPKGTAYVSDVGMNGPLNSILGVPVQNSLEIFLGGKFSYEVEESNPVMINAVYAEIENGCAVKVEKIYREVNISL